MPRLSKPTFTYRHFDKAIRQFGERQNHSEQHNKLEKGQVIACNFAVQLKHRPVKQVQTIRTATDVGEYRITEHCVTDKRVRVHCGCDDCTRCNTNKQKPALEQWVVAANSTSFCNKHHIAECPHHVCKACGSSNRKCRNNMTIT